jgi:hypothetical protein
MPPSLANAFAALELEEETTARAKASSASARKKKNKSNKAKAAAGGAAGADGAAACVAAWLRGLGSGVCFDIATLTTLAAPLQRRRGRGRRGGRRAAGGVG